MLFQLETGSDDPDEVLQYHAAEGGVSAETAAFAGQLIRGVLANREKLDTILRDASEHWKLEQMAKVDRIILRIAVWELTIDPNDGDAGLGTWICGDDALVRITDLNFPRQADGSPGIEFYARIMSYSDEIPDDGPEVVKVVLGPLLGF